MAVPTDAELQKLLDQFVCVRLVQMWGVDLTRFQFDFAMTWAVFFQNADATTYGRYGTRSALKNESARDASLAGFKRAIEGAIEVHARYGKGADTVRGELAGKQVRRAPEWDRPETIPKIAGDALLATRFNGPSENRSERAHGVGCIHCHNVPDNELLSLRLAGKPIPEKLVWPYPMPGAVGLQLDPDQRAAVLRVRDGSAAAKAGIQPGDEVLRMAGQPILSPADVQWVLHNAPGEGSLAVDIRRAREMHRVTLPLEADWRRNLGDWRFVNLGVCMHIAGSTAGRPAAATRPLRSRCSACIRSASPTSTSARTTSSSRSTASARRGDPGAMAR